MNKENKKFWRMYAKLTDIEKFSIAYKIAIKRMNDIFDKVYDLDYFDVEDIQTEITKFDKKNNIKNKSPIGDIKELLSEKKVDMARNMTLQYIRKERGDLEDSRLHVKMTEKFNMIEFLFTNSDLSKMTIKDGSIKCKNSEIRYYNDNTIKLAKKCFIANNDIKMAELCDKIMVISKMTNNGVDI